jgi:hypothetical protein
VRLLHRSTLYSYLLLLFLKLLLKLSKLSATAFEAVAFCYRVKIFIGRCYTMSLLPAWIFAILSMLHVHETKAVELLKSTIFVFIKEITKDPEVGFGDDNSINQIHMR